jgi:TPR repeat protein
MCPATARRFRNAVLIVFASCMVVASGRFALAMTYLYALDAHSAGDYAKALPIVYGNAMFDNSGACGLLGTMYLFGHGVDRNGSSAEYWLLKAAAGGSVSSQSVLGAMYATGRGVRRDEGKAQVWYVRAAVGGDAQAMVALRRLHKGKIV